ncbi:MAG: AAA family ATPase [Cyanobacteria bacterium P01_E01_bin.35]
MSPVLIIISGYSCTGKTTLAKKIGKHFSVPYLGRDDFQETLYDSLGYSDRVWSKKLGVASYKLLYLMTEKILASGSSIIIESNFKSTNDTGKLKNLKHRYQCPLIQIHCCVSIPLALTRFKARSQSRNRHPGHVDHLIYEEIEFNFRQGGYEILDICDHTLKIDTTDFNQINYTTIFQTIQKYLG